MSKYDSFVWAYLRKLLARGKVRLTENNSFRSICRTYDKISTLRHKLIEKNEKSRSSTSRDILINNIKRYHINAISEGFQIPHYIEILLVKF